MTPKTVCQRNITAPLQALPQAEFEGRTLYFCTQFCLEAFNADPERFYQAHSQPKNRKDCDKYHNAPAKGA